MKILIIDENNVTREFLPTDVISKTLEKQEAKLRRDSEEFQPKESKPDFKVFSVQSLSDHLGVSKPSIYRWIKAGWLKQVSIGGRTFFRQQDVELMLEERAGK